MNQNIVGFFKCRNRRIAEEQSRGRKKRRKGELRHGSERHRGNRQRKIEVRRIEMRRQLNAGHRTIQNRKHLILAKVSFVVGDQHRSGRRTCLVTVNSQDAHQFPFDPLTNLLSAVKGGMFQPQAAGRFMNNFPGSRMCSVASDPSDSFSIRHEQDISERNTCGGRLGRRGRVRNPVTAGSVSVAVRAISMNRVDHPASAVIRRRIIVGNRFGL